MFFPVAGIGHMDGFYFPDTLYRCPGRMSRRQDDALTQKMRASTRNHQCRSMWQLLKKVRHFMDTVSPFPGGKHGLTKV